MKAMKEEWKRDEKESVGFKKKKSMFDKSIK